MYCSKCGGLNEDTTNFCSQCGNSLNGSAATVSKSDSVTKEGGPTNFVVLSIICAVVSLFLLPPIIGGLGIYFGYRVKTNGNESLGTTLMIVSGICLVLGMIIGAAMVMG